MDNTTLSTRKMTSQDFAKNIEELEKEGNQLLDATHTLSGVMTSGSETHGPGDISTCTYSNGTLNALVDISAEQRTIKELMEKLDSQNKETERLQRQLHGDTPRTSHYKPPASSLSKLDIPTMNTIPDLTTYLPRSELERQLKEAKLEVAGLRKRLKETMATSEQQRDQFRSNVAELKSQLQQAVINRDNLLQRKQCEKTEQETLACRQLQNIQRLEETNRAMEQTMLGMNEKLESLESEQYLVDTATNQLRGLLLELERKRGHTFSDSELITKMPVGTLVRMLERCIQEMDAETDLQSDKLQRMALELEEVKLLSKETQNRMNQEHEDKLIELTQETRQRLQAASESYTETQQQAAYLQQQVQTLTDQNNYYVQMKEGQIAELERELHSAKQQSDEEREKAQEKEESLEKTLEDCQRELTQVKSDRDRALHQTSSLESRLGEIQRNLGSVENELEKQKERCRTLERREETKNIEEEEWKQQIRQKDDLVERLEKSMEATKKDYEAQLHQTVVNLEKEGKEQNIQQINHLTMQLTTMTEKAHKLTLDVELGKSDVRNLQEKCVSLSESQERLRTQLDSELRSKDRQENSLRDKQSELTRVNQEKDHYFKTLNERNDELVTVRCIKDKLSVQLEEREKNFLSLHDQNDKLSQMLESNNQTLISLKDERDDFMKRLNEKIIETEEMRHARDDLLKKMKIREKHNRELQEDNVNLAEELKSQRTDTGTVGKEKDTLFRELKESRYEVSKLKREKQELERQHEEKETELVQKIDQLKKKVRASDHEFKLARRTLKTREEVDGKALKVAGKMQKEVTEKRGHIDSLQSKLRWLEECLEASLKSKKVLQEENGRLSSTIKKTAEQNKKCLSEVKLYTEENRELHQKIKLLEAALEKTAMTHAATQARAEQYEQDMARLKLKHQLELKEMERTGKVTRSSHVDLPAPTSQSQTRHGSHVELAPSSQSQTRLSSHVDLAPSSHTQTNPRRSSHRDRVENIRPSIAGQEEYPVSQKPKQADVENFAAENGVGKELRELLDEMRTLLYGQQAMIQSQPSTQQHQITPHYQTTRLSSQEPGFDMTAENTDYARRKNILRAQNNATSDLDTNTSSISDLLISSSKYVDLFSESDLTEASQLRDVRQPPLTRQKGLGKTSLPSGFDELCKRLEKKVQNLTKIGGNIQQENQEMAKIMKDQDKKLKKVKTQIVK